MFYGCTGLTSITIPKTLESCGGYVFEKTGITKAEIENGATSVLASLFTNCTTLKEVIIPDTVISIGNSAFSGCSSLSKITIPDSVTSIGGSAFSRSGLVSIAIPYKITEISSSAFLNCSSLEEVSLPSNLKAIYTSAFNNCTSLKSIAIPDMVTSIGGSAFYNCNSLVSVEIPDSVTSIGSEAFYKCISLTSVNIPAGVKQIGSYAFGYYYDSETSARTKIPGFKIYCHSGSIGEYYAKKNSFTYELLDHTHSYGTWTTTKAATCTASGTQTRKCSCGAYETKTISALGHNYVTSVVKPTYTAKGYTLHKCSRCGNSYKDNYTNKLTLPAVTGLKLGGRASNALRLNWTKNSSADGYIIEQYKSGKWVRIAKITSNATTTYRVTGLAAGTAYKFRMKAYKMSGSTAIYSSYTSTFAARTNPSNVTGVKIGGKASTALRLNWTKNTSADGYIVEIYKGGKWVRAAKITKNTTLTYRISGLAKNTTYKIRIKAYKMSGSTALYSGYTTISGKTTA